MQSKPAAASTFSDGGGGISADGGQDAPRHPVPFRRIFLLALAFLYLPFAYTYGAKMHAFPFVDLPSFYYGAQTAFRHHQSPYSPGALNWGAQALHQRVFPFLYPPPTLLLFSPLAVLPYKAAKLLVLAANHLCILGLLLLLLRLLGLDGFLRPRADPAQQSGRARTDGGAREVLMAVFLTVYLFLFWPVVVTLMTGQINFYVIVLLCLMWYALKKDVAPVLAAVPFALAIALKTYPILFLPVLIIKGKWRMAGWTLGFLALLAAASFAVLPRAVWHDWLVYVLPYGGYTKTPPGLFTPSAVENQSVNAFASRLFLDPQTAIRVSPLAAKVTAYSLCAALFGAEVLLSWRLRNAQKAAKAGQDGARQGGSLDMEFALFLLTMYLIAPLSWEHHLVFVLPACFLALARILSVREGVWTTLWAAGAAFLIAWPVPMENAGLESHFFHLLLSLKFFAVVALWLFFAARLVRLLRADEGVVAWGGQ